MSGAAVRARRGGLSEWERTRWLEEKVWSIGGVYEVVEEGTVGLREGAEEILRCARADLK